MEWRNGKSKNGDAFFLKVHFRLASSIAEVNGNGKLGPPILSILIMEYINDWKMNFIGSQSYFSFIL